MSYSESDVRGILSSEHRLATACHLMIPQAEVTQLQLMEHWSCRRIQTLVMEYGVTHIPVEDNEQMVLFV